MLSLHLEFFSYMPLILGIFVILVGAGLLAEDEERGRLDLILAYPISRSRLFWGRWLASIFAVISILLSAWLGFVVVAPSTGLNLSALELGLPFISLFSVLFLFHELALLLSVLLPARRYASMIAGLLLVASFFISSLAQLDEGLQAIARFSPLDYYQGGPAIAGIDWSWLGVCWGLDCCSICWPGGGFCARISGWLGRVIGACRG